MHVCVKSSGNPNSPIPQKNKKAKIKSFLCIWNQVLSELLKYYYSSYETKKKKEIFKRNAVMPFVKKENSNFVKENSNS